MKSGIKHTIKKTVLPVGKQKPYQLEPVARLTKPKRIPKQHKFK